MSPTMNLKELNQNANPEKKESRTRDGVTASQCCGRNENDLPDGVMPVKSLDRFIEAQNRHHTYETALQEIKAGKKKTHWVWFVFPQMAGLGKSVKSNYYGISNRDEARAYLENDTLKSRLIEVTEAVYYSDRTVYEIFGHDAVKVACCMKLFASVSDIPIFKKMLEKYCWK